MVALTGGGARVRRAGEAGLAAAAHHRLRAWDGEEPALLGSTEWAEPHADELREKAVAYLNTDGNGRGFLGAGGSHSLERFINEVARDVDDPETGLSVWKRAQAARPRRGPSPCEREELRERARPPDRRARLGLGLHAVPPAPRRRVAQPRLRRRGRRRHLPLDLRRLPLVHALHRHRLRLRPRAGADRRHRRDAARERRPAAVRVRRAGRTVRDCT